MRLQAALVLPQLLSGRVVHLARLQGDVQVRPQALPPAVQLFARRLELRRQSREAPVFCLHRRQLCRPNIQHAPCAQPSQRTDSADSADAPDATLAGNFNAGPPDEIRLVATSALATANVTAAAHYSSMHATTKPTALLCMAGSMVLP